MPDSVTRACFYDAAGRDPAQFAKLLLPDSTMQDFKDLNKGFGGWNIMNDFHRPATYREWWKPDSLNGTIHLQNHSADSQDCRDISIGYENGILVIYLSWFTT